MDFQTKCPKCQGTKRFKSKDGTLQPCWDCLAKGDMDQHSTNLKSAEELRIKL